MQQNAIFATPNLRNGGSSGYAATAEKDGAVAQSVEQRTENPCVGGSIPPHTTKKNTKPIVNQVITMGFSFEIYDVIQIVIQ